VHVRSLTPRLAVVTATVLAAATLTPTPATAAPVFLGADFATETFAHDDSTDCTEVETTTPEVSGVPVTENGPAVTHTASGSATIEHGTEMADTATVSATVTLTSKVSSVAGNLAAIVTTAHGSGAITTALPTSGCVAHAGASGDTQFAFQVAQPGWLTVQTDMTRNSSATWVIAAVDDPSEPVHEETSWDFQQSTTRRMFLPAGIYFGATSVSVEGSGSSTRTFAGKATLRASFAVAGAQTIAPRGKGARYVALASRSCTDGSVAAKLTGRTKRAKRVDTVTFFVNDKRVLRDANPKKGEAYRLPVAGTADAEVVAVVRLKKPKPGKKAKTTEVTSSYAACS
jgi:hypothetical protein